MDEGHGPSLAESSVGRLAAAMPSGTAQGLEDCDGENLAALAGVVGSEEGKQSWLIDFDLGRALVLDLLTVLAWALPILQESGCTHWLRDDSTARITLDRVGSGIAKAHVKTA